MKFHDQWRDAVAETGDVAVAGGGAPIYPLGLATLEGFWFVSQPASIHPSSYSRSVSQSVEPSSPHFTPISNTTALSGMEAMNQLQVRLKT